MLSLADTYYRLQKSAEAEQAVGQLALLAEKDPQLRLQLGLLLIENEKAPEALKQLELARQQLQPSFALAFGLGSTYLQLQQPAEAAASFQEAIRLETRRARLFLSGQSVR